METKKKKNAESDLVKFSLGCIDLIVLESLQELNGAHALVVNLIIDWSGSVCELCSAGWLLLWIHLFFSQ